MGKLGQIHPMRVGPASSIVFRNTKSPIIIWRPRRFDLSKNVTEHLQYMYMYMYTRNTRMHSMYCTVQYMYIVNVLYCACAVRVHAHVHVLYIHPRTRWHCNVCSIPTLTLGSTQRNDLHACVVIGDERSVRAHVTVLYCQG